MERSLGSSHVPLLVHGEERQMSQLPFCGAGCPSLEMSTVGALKRKNGAAQNGVSDCFEFDY